MACLPTRGRVPLPTMATLAPPTSELPPPTVPDVSTTTVPQRLEAAYPGFLRPFLNWAFTPVRVPPDAAAELSRLSAQGTLVVVGRSAAFVAFLFLQHLFVRLGLPAAQAVAGLGARVWRRWWWALAGRRAVRAPRGADVVSAARAGETSLVFLRKPGSLVASVREMGDPFPELVKAQRTLDRPILLVPQILVWERTPPHLRRNLLDVLFGEPEAPGLWRSLLGLVRNRRQAFVKFGQPVDLRAFLAEQPGLSDEVIARKVRGVLHQHLARETRVITGPPLKTPDRLIFETLRDRSLRATLAEIARERGRADGSVEREAEKDLREIAARYSPRVIDLVRWILDWVFERIYDGVDVDEEGLRRLARAAAHAPLVVCPSHKSHIDYLIMSWAFFERGLIPPHIAAGINLSFWPLGPVFRKCGAFFIRRSFKGDRVYAAVLKAYVRKLLKDGFSQEFFLEGGRSRNGKVLLPRFGMLTMEVDAWCDGVRPDVAFAPVWIGYEKMIEARSYARELSGGEKKPEDLGALLRAPKVLTSRYGRIYIRFDEPISLAQLAALRGFDRANPDEDGKRALVRALGFRVVEGINRVTVLTPMGLLCTVLLSHDRRGLSQLDLVDRMAFLLELARDAGAPLGTLEGPDVCHPATSEPLRQAIAVLRADEALVVHETGDEQIFSLVEDERVTLDYHKNTALHWWVPTSLVATALLTTTSRRRDDVHDRTLALSRVFKQEFIYGAGSFSELFDWHLTALTARGLLDETDGLLAVTDAGRARLRQLADLLVNYVEAYLHATEALTLLLDGPVDAKEWMKSTLDRARAAWLAGRLRRFESRSKLTFENAFALYEELGVVVRTGDKGRQRALAPAFATREAVDARTAELRAFLVEKSD